MDPSVSARGGGVDLIPETDAPVIARLRQAGAVILGKTNVPALSLSATNANDSWAGPTYNAAAPERAPGGSSTGTATAVAASLAVLGLAEETAGSIQNPAAAQALVGIKPTFGLVPSTGVFPLATSTRDVVGPIARTVYDAAMALDIIAEPTSDYIKTITTADTPLLGYAQSLTRDALRNRRLGILGPGWRGDLDLSIETVALYDTALHVLEDRGATIVHDPFVGSDFAALAAPSAQFGDIRGGESIVYDLENYLRRLGNQAAVRCFREMVEVVGQNPFMGEGLLAYHNLLEGFDHWLEHPATSPDPETFAKVRNRYVHAFNEVMNVHRLDALAYPQACCELPLLHSGDAITETTVSEINIGGFPGITVPAGYYNSGSPFSLIFVGRLFDEATLLPLAYDYEQSTMLRRKPLLRALTSPSL